MELTRATPVVVTYGPARLNGSVRMVGLLPRSEYLEEWARRVEYYAYEARPRGLREALMVLLDEVYVEDALDPLRLGGLEIAFKHTWTNIRATGRATLVFYTPPDESYEARCSVEVHEEGAVKRYLNALHDLLHPSEHGKSDYPAYVFKVEEVYDNSSRPGGYGRRIYP